MRQNNMKSVIEEVTGTLSFTQELKWDDKYMDAFGNAPIVLGQPV
jgi:hypothetical protein